jgi:hypothetical protein
MNIERLLEDLRRTDIRVRGGIQTAPCNLVGRDEDFDILVGLAHSNLVNEWQKAHPEPDEWDEGYENWEARRDRAVDYLYSQAIEFTTQRLAHLGPGPKGAILYRGYWTIVHSRDAESLNQWLKLSRIERRRS